MSTPATDCPPDLLNQVIAVAETDDARALQLLDDLLEDYPRDARLHFLRGSLRAGVKRFDEARVDIRRAVEIAPDFAVARFQLGLLELSSGAAEEADRTLTPLNALPSTDTFHWLSRGLQHLMRDEMSEAIAKLQAGMALNMDNPAINADMRMIIRSIEALPPTTPGAEPTSSTHWLLQQNAARTRH